MTMICFLVGYLLFSHVSSVVSLSSNKTETLKIGALLRNLNKPSIKTIKSPAGGDTIECVLLHQQPAFDHPKLKGQTPILDPPERPKGYQSVDNRGDDDDPWSCPRGTIPIRRTTRQDIIRAGSVRSFGRKPKLGHREWDSANTSHQHAVGYAMGTKFYGAKASLNVWSPRVNSPTELSLSQIWVIAGSFGNDLNTIEAGWQVSPQLYGDNNVRFFTYWTSDAYQETGCYNLLCSGFVQTSNKIAIGAVISPTSAFDAEQYDINLLVWKDPKHGHWWLELGSWGVIGYWPSVLFSHLSGHASMVQFGGEIVDTAGSSSTNSCHPSAQMGSGHFAEQGFRRAAYFRNLQLVDWDNNLIPSSNLHFLADNPNWYSIKGGFSNAWSWRNYFYYGGPGRNISCTSA